MEKLISMTEFVLRQGLQSTLMIEKGMLLCNKYANFLNQPLELGMFIPCDLDDNILEEPKPYINWLENWKNIEGFEDCIKYREAQERVLFKDFELIEISTNLKIVINQKKDCQVFANQYQNVYYKCKEFDKIEGLCSYDLTLTQTALKQIGIK